MKLNNCSSLVTSLLLLFMITSCSQPSSPRENLQTAIADAIVMLENNRIEELVKTYIPPEKLAAMLKKNDLKDLISKNKAANMKPLLTALRSAQLLEPDYSEDLRSAKFRTSPNELIMVNIDGYWYIK